MIVGRRGFFKLVGVETNDLFFRALFIREPAPTSRSVGETQSLSLISAPRESPTMDRQQKLREPRKKFHEAYDHTMIQTIQIPVC